jgi:outer membrane immunogenic protein
MQINEGRVMRNFLLGMGLVVAFALVTPASAQDWTGFYVGGNAGYGVDSARSAKFPPNSTNAVYFTDGDFPTTLETDASGFVGGGQLGYNYQLAPQWVVGVEGDMQGSDINGSKTVMTIPNGDIPFTTTLRQRNSWFGTLRPRAGYIFPNPNWLTYVTAGLAVGNTSVRFNTLPTYVACSGSTTCANGSGSSVKLGWTIGAGEEVMIAANWTVKVEYLFVDLGRQSASAQSTLPGAVFKASARFEDHVVRIGVNYKFW